MNGFKSKEEVKEKIREVKKIVKNLNHDMQVDEILELIEWIVENSKYERI